MKTIIPLAVLTLIGAIALAATAAPKKPLTMAQLQEQVDQQRIGLADLQTQVADLRKEVASLKDSGIAPPAAVPAKKPAQDADTLQRIKEAVRAGKVIVGMTKEQARGVLEVTKKTLNSDRKSERMVAGKRVETETWYLNGFASELSRVDLEDGIVVRVEY